jgi:hypothetical protein
VDLRRTWEHGMKTPIGPVSILLIFTSMAFTTIMMHPGFTTFIVFIINACILVAARWSARREAVFDYLQRLKGK